MSCGAGAQQPPPSASWASGGVEQAGAAADSGLGEGEFHAVGGLQVAGDRRGDGADLFVAGHGEERRGAAVGLHPDQVHALFGVRELAVAVRVDGAAGVLVGVDQRGQGDGRLEALVEAQTQLFEEGQVGAEAGQHDHLVDRVQAATVLADQDQAAVGVALDRLGAKAGDRVRVSLVDGGLCREAEGAAGGQLVGFAASEGGAGDAAAQDPYALRSRAVVGLGEVGEGGERGGAGADDSGALACVPGPDGGGLQVRDAVGDPVRSSLLAERGQSAAAGGAGRGPGAGGVDDRAGEEALLTAVGAGDVNDERLLLAVGVHDPIAAGPGNTGDGGAGADAVAEDVGERLQVEVGPVVAGGVGGRVGACPAGRGEELFGGRVDDLAPGGEQAHVRPLAHRRTGGDPGLQDQGLDALADQVGGGGKTGGAGPDHDDRQLGGGGRVHEDSLACFDICRWLARPNMAPVLMSVNIDVHRNRKAS